MKKFRDLFEASGAPSQDFKSKKDADQEVKGLKPRSKGEEDFANAHSVEKINHPVSTEAQHSSTNAQQSHEGGKPNAKGETSPIKQGSSEEQAKGKEFKSMKQYGRPGDRNPVQQGSSKLKEEVELEEGVIDTLKKIKDRKQAMPVKFQNGKTLKVDLTTASALLSVDGALKPANSKKFRDNLEKGESTFMSMVDFAMQNA